MALDVNSTGRILGTGCYGSVEELTYRHIVCAGKKFHVTLVNVENEGLDEVVNWYLQECRLMSSIHHPNITQFLGFCFLPGTQLPLLVMEHLETSLGDLLDYTSNLQLSQKRSIMEDITHGLLFLHNRSPPVIHKDLTAENILVTSSLVAKITDVGNCRIATIRPGWRETEYPETLVYMPPEAQDGIRNCGAPMDVFSFGNLALYTLTQKFPGDLLPNTYDHPTTTQTRIRSELERRRMYIELLQKKIGADYPALLAIVKQCLQNDPCERPSTEELLMRVQEIRMKVEGKYVRGHPIKLDMVRVRLAKEVREKTKRMEELSLQQEAKLKVFKRQVEELQAEVEAKEHQIQTLNTQVKELLAEVQAKNEHISAKDDVIATKNDLISTKNDLITIKSHLLNIKDNEISSRDADISRLKEISEVQLEECREQEARLKKELAIQVTEVTRLRQALREHQGVSSKKELKLPFMLSWKCGPDMPFEMSLYVQSVVLQRKLYVGGGSVGLFSNDHYIVMEYDIDSKEWTRLPPYRASDFAMTVISSQLVLVGGNEYGRYSKALGVWGADNQVWEHPLPDMPTPRSQCSVAVYNEWLVVAGGIATMGNLSTVEVLNSDTKRWYVGSPTPIPWTLMKTVVVGDMAYVMGGWDNTGYSSNVYHIDIPTLLTQIISKDLDQHAWKKVPGLPLAWSSPLSISGSLLAVGGKDNYGKVATAIHLYQPDKETWVKAGDLQFPRCNCTCAVTTNGEIIVAGGEDSRQQLRRIDIALM